MKNVLFQTLDFKNMKTSYDFVETVNILHKFSVFESMRKHNSISGALSVDTLTRAVSDGVGPSKMFEIEDQDKMFNFE
jgi:hypothetical protein